MKPSENTLKPKSGPTSPGLPEARTTIAEDFKASKPDELSKKVRKKDALTGGDKTKHLNAIELETAKVVHWVKRCLVVFLGLLCGLLALGIAIGIAWLLWVWFRYTGADVIRTDEALRSGVFSILIAGATAFVTTTFRKKR